MKKGNQSVEPIEQHLLDELSRLIEQSQQQAAKQVNSALNILF